MDEDIEIIRDQAEKILASGLLGRSKFYASLLEFLLACAERGSAPKEMEIAAEVFKRGSEFDPSQDSMVRVYAHNLRQKLQQYYAADGKDEPQQITIPKGEYRLDLVRREPAPEPAAIGRDLGAGGRNGPRRLHWAVFVAVGVVSGALLMRVIQPMPTARPSAFSDVAQSALWSPLLDDDLPIDLVVGDYYIFGELDSEGNVDRLVREFAINSNRDLDEQIIIEPALASRYIDLDLTYLPSSTAVAMRDVLGVLDTSNKSVRVVSMSELDADDFKSSHVVYLGYISALDKLIDFVFRASELTIGRTYDELVDMTTGHSFMSEAGMPSARGNYRDYGLFSTFPGPAGNQFVIIAGTRDEGLMQSAQAVSEAPLVSLSLDAVADADGGTPLAFELLYEVAGFDRTNLDAKIVHTAVLDESLIWSGDPAFFD